MSENIAEYLAEAEKGEEQVSIAQIREILARLMDVAVENPAWLSQELSGWFAAAMQRRINKDSTK